MAHPPAQSIARQLTMAERLEEHSRLARAGATVAQIAKAQGISRETAYQDAHRLIEAARAQAGASKLEQMREADAWYRECIADADRLAAVPAQSSTAKATHQANKRAAVDSWVKLWGLQRQTNELPEGAEIRRIVIEEIRHGDANGATVEAVVGGRGDLTLPLPFRAGGNV